LIGSKTSPVVLIVLYPVVCPPVTTVSLVVVFSSSFDKALLLFCAMTEIPLRKEIAKAVVRLPVKSIEINIIFDLDV
jgi:hypothetical protein